MLAAANVVLGIAEVASSQAHSSVAYCTSTDALQRSVDAIQPMPSQPRQLDADRSFHQFQASSFVD